MTTPPTTRPEIHAVPPLPRDGGDNLVQVLDEAFAGLINELRGIAKLSTLQESSLRDSLAAIVRGQAQLVGAGLNNDQADQIRRTMRSAMNTIELVAQAQAFSAATITRRYAWSVFDRLLIAGVGVIGG